MPYYNECPICGSTLDPGERCDCEEVRTKQEEFFKTCIEDLEANQLSFSFAGSEVND